MLAMMIQPWSLSLLVAVAASFGALSCFLRGMKNQSDFSPDETSFSTSTFDSQSSTSSTKAGRGWVLLGLSCLLRAGIVVMESFLARAQLPDLIFKIVSSLLSLSLAGTTLIFCVGVFALAREAGEQWRSDRKTCQNPRASHAQKGHETHNEYSNEAARAQFDDLLGDETLHGDEQSRHLAGFLLVGDALIICASLAAVRWWLLVQPHTAFSASSVSTASLPAVGSLLHSLTVTGSLFTIVWLVITFALWKSIAANATRQSQKLARVSWDALLLGALLYAFADWRVFHHVVSPDFFDLLFQTLAPLCVGAAAWLARLSMRDDASISKVVRVSIAVASAPREFSQRVACTLFPGSNGQTRKSFSWRGLIKQFKQKVLRIFWHVAPSPNETDDKENPRNAASTLQAVVITRSWRARFLQWRDALTLYVPCLALGAVALRMSLWAFSFSSLASSTRSSALSPFPLLAGATATALHSWWLVLLFVSVGVRHLFFYRREQLTTRRLQNDISQLSREVATRTRQLLSLHTVGAGLTNTLNPDQIVAAALERMMEAVRAESGAVWLRANFDRELSRDGERKETPHSPGSTSSSESVNDRFFNADASGAHGESALAIEYSQGAYIGKIVDDDGEATAEASSFSAKQHPNGWRLLRAQGFESAAQKVGLEVMDSSLQLGGLPLCARECSTRKSEVGEFYLAPLHLDGEDAGILGVTRQRKTFEPVERRIMDAIATEVAVALRNAQLYQEAHRRAERDSLTELLNHRAIQEIIGVELGRARKENQELTLVMMDLNNFKFFNDTYGHPTGDGVLKTVARCLRETCRAGDIIGRYGGDEFIAILPRTGAANALKLCSAIEDRVERESFDTHDKDDRHIPINLSFGAAVFPNDGQQTLDLLSVADANLYEAKRGGAPITGLTSSAENSELRQLKEVGVGQSFGVLDALVTAIDNKDHYTRRHSEDVTHWALLMARELDFPIEQQRAVRISGLLHDVGKIAVPDSILRKPGRLNDDEFGILQQHPVFGALIVKDVPNLPEVLGGIRHHHERFDGKGYPDKLAGENIPLFGRLLSIPDCFSAMTTNRPYRKALTWAEAFTEIEAGSGTQFDPQMVDAFLEVMARIVSQKNQQEKIASAGSSKEENNLSPRITPHNTPTTSLAATRSALIGETVAAELSAYGSEKDVPQSDARKKTRGASGHFVKPMAAQSSANNDTKSGVDTAQDTSQSENSPIITPNSAASLTNYDAEDKRNQNADEATLPTFSDDATTSDDANSEIVSAKSALANTSTLVATRLRHTPRNSLTSLKDSDVFADD